MSIRIDPAWVSPKRFDEYLQAAGGDIDVATELYEWNARVSSALFELIHHFEVLLRNAIIEQLRDKGPGPNMAPGSPWLQGARKIAEVEGRLKQRNRSVTEARVYAGLTFGFWQTMFGAEYEELWIHTLQYVFPRTKTTRKVIAVYLESVNDLRNRIAHHGSLIDRDTKVEAQKIIRLAGWIDPKAAEWMSKVEQVSKISDLRSVQPQRNVLVVANADAWKLYYERHKHAYIHAAGRPLRLVEYVAFYADQEIKPKIAKITNYFVSVDWNLKNGKRLERSSDSDEKILGSLIPAAKNLSWNESAYQVYILSEPKATETLTLSSPIKHSKRGRGSAFVRSHRYLSLTEIQSASDTADLDR
ncbi:Abi family protein [Arthrobacter sp. Rue61a]|uniref:Abi family protein n=1 Tax=Arthrobacter sp. Rue61a TaxID=1118963 RepID=UPI00027DF498|nr:Abi family protein [Arthrobacter sp. Rue61a]AFR31401.1 hypothetical protein ARUE_232p01930 [Arthrobacter sp. Rue61a]